MFKQFFTSLFSSKIRCRACFGEGYNNCDMLKGPPTTAYYLQKQPPPSPFISVQVIISDRDSLYSPVPSGHHVNCFKSSSKDPVSDSRHWHPSSTHSTWRSIPPQPRTWIKQPLFCREYSDGWSESTALKIHILPQNNWLNIQNCTEKGRDGIELLKEHRFSQPRSSTSTAHSQQCTAQQLLGPTTSTGTCRTFTRYASPNGMPVFCPYWSSG